MSEFIIQCAVCSVSFAEETLYEKHSCEGFAQGTGMHIKLELPDDDEEEEELDVKPVLNCEGQIVVQKRPSTKGKKAESDADKKALDNDDAKRLASMTAWAQRQMSKGKRRKKKKRKSAPNEDTQFSVDATCGEKKRKLTAEEDISAKIESEDCAESEKKGSMPVYVKPEPIELCEIVNVKEEPEDADEEAYTGAPDPLASTVQDILGLEDEDYLIENFVEYDEEISNDLEIIDSLPDNPQLNECPHQYERPEEQNQAPNNLGNRIIATNNRGHGCTICSKKFFEKSMLEEHVKLAHRTPRPYACSVCHKRFTHKNYVNLHMRVHTGEKPYKCPLCARSYSHKTSFTIHMRIHKGDRPYECTVCGKKCYDKSGLTSHMRSHTKETPYQCECCGRKFTHSKSLLVHRRNHTGEKPYVCPHCGRAFRHWHKHKIHIRLHTGERPYKCTICNKGFPRNDEVKRHMKSHMGIKSFKCSICGVYCATQASITGHINLHHVNLATNRKFLPDKTIVQDSQSGILGTKIVAQRSMHRQVDNTSYNEFHDLPVPIRPSNVLPQTIVSTRPMTPQEKVNNKSMTYRQFLNDQEQQLLAKGLKVVNKNNNTYGLAPVGTGVNMSVDQSSQDDSLTDSKQGVDNAFIKVQNVRKSANVNIKPATRIILPNYSANNKSPLVLGEAATKLLLQSVDQGVPTTSASQQTTVKSNNGQSQQIFIQTVGNNMSIASPVMMQQAITTQQSFVVTSQPSLASQSNKSTGGTVLYTTAATCTGSGSILQAALTSSNNNARQRTTIGNGGVMTASPETETDNIIVLNKGMSGGGPGVNTAGNNVNPVVMLPQPVMQQQLLLLPGINGGPARLVLLQPNNAFIKPVTPALAPPAAAATVKQEPGVPTAGSLGAASILSNTNTILMLSPNSNIGVSCGNGVPAIKQELVDNNESTVVHNIKTEMTSDEGDTPQRTNPVIMPNMIKLEPAD